jgi:hypothetical protein
MGQDKQPPTYHLCSLWALLKTTEFLCRLEASDESDPSDWSDC